MDIRAKVANDIAGARTSLHEGGVADREKRHAQDPYGADAEPDQADVSDSDVETAIARWLAEAASIRAYVAKHGAGWREVVRQRWLVRAEELEWLHEQCAPTEMAS